MILLFADPLQEVHDGDVADPSVDARRRNGVQERLPVGADLGRQGLTSGIRLR